MALYLHDIGVTFRNMNKEKKRILLVTTDVPASDRKGWSGIPYSLKNELVKYVMNFREIIEENDSQVGQFIDIIHDREPGYPLEGHCPALTGFDLARYLYLGIRSDHCTHDLEELRQRFENGMFIQLQDVMVTREVISFVMENSLYDFFSFVTDDTLPDVLYRKGHVDTVMRKAIGLGMRPEDAIYCTTFTPSRRMNLLDRGVIAPGMLADFVLLDDLENLHITSTYKKGRCIFDIEAPETGEETYSLNGRFEETVHSRRLDIDDFRVKIEGEDRSVRVRAMKIDPENNRTDETFITMRVKDRKLQWKETGCRLVMAVERHGRDNHIAYGFATGTAIREGACASSYSHDSHDLIVMGVDEEDMMVAINEVIGMQGGIAVALNGRISARIALPIAGLLSRNSVRQTALEFEKVRSAFDAQGYEHINNIMNFSLLSLTCIPSLKLTDRGYLDTVTFQMPPLYEEIDRS